MNMWNILNVNYSNFRNCLWYSVNINQYIRIDITLVYSYTYEGNT